MRLLKQRSRLRTYAQEAAAYNLAEYPGVKLHWKCNETSGTDMVDEVRGLILRPSVSIEFGNPAYSVHLEGATDDPIIGTYPTFDTTKFILSLGIGRCTDSASGRLTLGQVGGSSTRGPGIALSFLGGMHLLVDDGTTQFFQSSANQLTAGTDYILSVVVRPTGGNIEGNVHDLSGNVVYQLTKANTGLTPTLTPVNMTRPMGIAFYQWIVYQFATEPPNLLLAIIEHAHRAMAGIKAPFPAWKNRAA